MQPKLRRLVEPVLRNPEYKHKLERSLRSVGYDPTDWTRTVMYRECYELILGLGPETLDVLEISAGKRFSDHFRFRSFTDTQFPEFDICAQVLPKSFDLIIADQVFDHLKWPYRAGKHVFAMLRPGGHFLVATPFLIRVTMCPLIAAAGPSWD
jgi:SAM-dependent methyltransferase